MIERKFRGISSSPNKATKMSFMNDTNEKNNTKNSSTPVSVGFRSFDLKFNETQQNKTESDLYHSKSNSINLGSLNEAKKAFSICNLPSDSSFGNKTTIASDPNNRESLLNNLFNTIYNKLFDFKTRKKENESIQDCFLDLFDTLSNTYDTNFKKISELIKTIKTDSESKFKKDIEQMKLNMDDKDKKLRSLTLGIEKLSKENENLDNQLKLLKKQVKTLKSSVTSLSEENKTFKNSIKDYLSELEFLREKEMKMMEVMYLLKNKGISLDDVIKEAADNRRSRENLTDESLISNATVYFPDKITMKPNGVQKSSLYIPPLNFSNIPSYETDEDNKNKNKKK